MVQKITSYIYNKKDEVRSKYYIFSMVESSKILNLIKEGGPNKFGLLHTYLAEMGQIQIAKPKLLLDKSVGYKWQGELLLTNSQDGKRYGSSNNCRKKHALFEACIIKL